VTGGVLEKPRITIRLESDKEYQVLNEWAEQEFISVAQLVKSIVRKALSSRIVSDEAIASSPTSKKVNIDTDIPTLVRTNMNKLRKTGVKSLPAIANGKQLPSVSDFSIIAAELELTPEEQRQIWIKTFNHVPKGEGTAHGSH
jgi:hypothetical protein